MRITLITQGLAKKTAKLKFFDLQKKKISYGTIFKIHTATSLGGLVIKQFNTSLFRIQKSITIEINQSNK